MKEKKFSWKQLIASILVITMLATSVSLEAFATGNSNSKTKNEQMVETEEKGKEEYQFNKDDIIQSELTTDSTTYDMGNGKKVTEFYSQDVRFIDENGNLTDYDPSLIKIQKKKSKHGEELKEYAYENKAGDKKQYFPEELTEVTPILMEYEEYQIKVVPTEIESGTATESLEVEEEKVTDVYEEEKTVPLKAVYRTGDDNITYQYTSSDIGIKEEIVLEEIPDTNVFKSIIEIPGLTIRENSMDEGLTIYDGDDIVAGIQAPNMNDAGGESYSEDAGYDLTVIDEETGKYLLTLTVDESYLKDEKRQYPVTIDPTIRWSGDSKVSDVSVMGGSAYRDTNYYDSGITSFSLGDSTQGISRTYISFSSTGELTGRCVDSAEMVLTEYESSISGQTINAHRVTSSWKKYTVTWNNKPGYHSTVIGSVKTTGIYKNKLTLDLTTFFQGDAKGSYNNFGILLKNASEGRRTGEIYGSRHSLSECRPKLTIVHYDPPTAPATVEVAPEYVKKGERVTAKWSGIHSQALSYVQYRLAGYDHVNNKETDTITPYSSSTKLLKVSSGSKTIIASTDWGEGEYILGIRGVDSSGLTGGEKTAFVYVDGTLPTMDVPVITPTTTSEEPTNNLTPVITWSNAADTYFKQTEYRLDNGSFKKMGVTSSGTYTFPKDIIDANGEHTITVRAVDKAGNETSYELKYYVDYPQIGLLGYLPEEDDIQIRNEYGKNMISWEIKKELSDSVFYRIYRGESPDFTADDTTLIADHVKGTYWTDIQSVSDKVYYYKIEIIRNDTVGNVEDRKFLDMTLSSQGTSAAALQKRTGQKEYLGYYHFATPIGNGTIEKSEGNLNYSQEDASITENHLTLDIGRSYNSQLSLNGMFGTGWTDSLHKELLKDEVGNIYYLEGDGTVYKFTENNGSYSCDETKEYELKAEETAYSYTIKTREGLFYCFNEGGQLEAVQEPNGATLLYQYRKDGKLGSVRTENEEKITLTYNENGNLEEILLPDDSELFYVYTDGVITESGHSSAEKEESVSNHYGYLDGKLVTVTDRKDEEYQIEYSQDKAQKVIYPNQETYELSYKNQETTTTKKNEEGDTIYTTSTEYDTSTGKVLKETDADGRSVSYAYEFASNPYLVTKTTSRTGYQELLNGKVVFKTEEKVAETSYDSEEKVTEEVSEDGTVTTYTYDGTTEWNEDLPTEVTSVKDGKIISATASVYDEAGNVIKETDYTNINYQTVTDNSYDEAGNLTNSTVTEDGLVTSSTEASYDQYGNIITEKETSAEVVYQETSTYDEMGRTLTSTDDTTGEVTAYTYDFLGRAIRTESTLNGKTLTSSSQYDANGTVISETDTLGITTTYAYDELNRLTERTISKDESVTYTTSYSYGDVTIRDGRTQRAVHNAYVEKECYPDGTAITEKYYDANGKLIREKSAGLYTDHTYDESGNEVVSYISGTQSDAADGRVELTLYDREGRQTASVTNPDVENGEYAVGEHTVITTQTYDGKGNVAEETDANGIVTKYIYDDSSRVVKLTQDANGKKLVTTVAYVTDLENETSTTFIVDAKGHVSTEIKNVAGLIKATTDDGEEEDESIRTSYEYDTRGNQTKVTYENHTYKKYEYDDRNLLVNTKAYDDQGVQTHQTDYTYDDQHRLIKSVDSKAEDTDMVPFRYSYIGYDTYGRTAWTAEMNSESEPVDELIENHRITYTYDLEDKVTAISYALVETGGVEELHFIYDNNRWLTAVQAEVKGTDVVRNIREYTYDNHGKVSEIKEYPGFKEGGNVCITKTYTYDELDQVTSMVYKKGTAILESYQYEYDKNGNIIEKTEINNTPVNQTDKVNETKQYTYDSLGRLVQTITTDHLNNNAVSTIAYEYDKVGNRTKKTEGGTETIYTYNGLDQLLTAVTKRGGVEDGRTTYTYDANGNQIKEINTETLTTTINTYDPENRLSKVTRTSTVSGNAVETIVQENLYNGEGQRIQKKEGANVTNYFYQDGVVSYTTEGTSDTKVIQNLFGLEGNVIIAEKNVESSDSYDYYLYNKDIQGSTVSILDETGSGELSYTYDDFGETEIHGNSSFENEICYTGGIYDASTGLYYLNARYYEPVTGRFLTMDTYRGELNDPDTMHLYVYCKNNPINYVDPSGQWVETAIDVLSIGWSLVEFTSAPSWIKLGNLLWDVGASFIPFVPGSYTVKACKWTKKGKMVSQLSLKVPDTINDLKKGKKYLTIGKYKELRKLFKGKGSKYQCHHIIEKRFKHLKLKENDYPSIVITNKLHKTITKRWLKEIPKGNYKNLSKKQLINAANKVYCDMPELKKIAINTIKRYYK